MSVHLDVDIVGINFKNPLIVSGGVPSWRILARALELGVGGVIFGSIGLKPLSSHPPPFIIRLPYGFVNAYGIRHGLKDVEAELSKIVDLAERMNARVICSCVEEKVEDMIFLARELEGRGCSIVELNLSAPVIKEVLEKGLDVKVLSGIVERVAKGIHIPLSVKLSPLIVDISFFAKHLHESGAKIIHLINALSPALVLDIISGKPILRTVNGLGALSGPAIKPIALAKVYLTARDNPHVPIIGTGGISDWRDAVEMIMAGAWAVGIHSALYIHGLKVIREIIDGIRRYMAEQGFSSLDELRGLAFRK